METEAAAAVTSAFAANGSAASAAASASKTLASSLAGNTRLVGSAWIVSSAFLTTYSTTSFLKYTDVPREKLEGPTARKGDGAVVIEDDDSSLLSLSRPALLTLYRFSGSLLLGLVLHTPVRDVLGRARQTADSVRHFALPAAFLFAANFCNSIALDRIGISLTYTSKCGIPLITVLLTLILDGAGALPPLPALLSLVPIAAGIAAASWNHPTFEAVGFAAAVVSSTAQAALNVASKRVMSATGIAGPDAQRAMVAVALVITVAMTSVNLIRHKTRDDPALEGERAKMISMEEMTSPIRGQPPFWLSWAAVFSYHVEYILSFIFVKLVEPVTFGTCDAIRRLTIIVSGHHMFGGEPFTKVNIFGIGLALLGALAYAVSSS